MAHFIYFQPAPRCIKKKTYDMQEILSKGFLKRENVNLLENISDWKVNLGFFEYSKCFTFNSSILMGSSRNQAVKLSFLTNVTLVFLHDPDFFMLNPNPKTFPRIEIKMTREIGKTFIYIEITNHKKVRYLFWEKCLPCINFTGAFKYHTWIEGNLLDDHLCHVLYSQICHISGWH